MVIYTAGPRNPAMGLVVLLHKPLPVLPSKKARLMHSGIRETPKTILLIRNEMCSGYDGVIAIEDDTTDGTLCEPTKDYGHILDTSA